MAPRIPEEDIIHEGLVEPGDWIRTPLYGGVGHFIINDKLESACGRAMTVPHESYSKMSEWVYAMTAVRGKELKDGTFGKPKATRRGDWYVAYDRRASGHCGPCKSGGEARLAEWRKGQGQERVKKCTCPSPIWGASLQERAKEQAVNRQYEWIRATIGGTYVCEVHDGDV